MTLSVNDAHAELMLNNGGLPAIELLKSAFDFETRMAPADFEQFMARVQMAAFLGSRLSEQPRIAPDLIITIRSANDPIFVESRRGALNFSERQVAPLRDASNILRLVREEIAIAYRVNDGNIHTIKDAVDVLSLRLSQLLPIELQDYLRKDEVRSVELVVDVSIDFPIELFNAGTNGETLLLCERAEISRWYFDTPARFDASNKRIANIGFVEGELNDGIDGEILAVRNASLPSNDFIARSSNEVRAILFQSSDLDLFHFKGHIYNDGNSEPGLSMKGSAPLSLAHVDLAANRSPFFKRSPFVFLNGCDASVPTSLIGGKRTFPFSFIQGNASGVVSTLWQIGEEAGEHFTRAFYEALRSGSRVSAAVRKAREALSSEAQLAESANDYLRFKVFYLGMYGYVFYGPSDLTVSL